MSQVELRKYNVLLTTAKAISFDLFEIDGIDFSSSATFAAGDVTVSLDGAAETNITNLPTDEGQGYRIILTAAELSAARIRIAIVDQTATKVWLDRSIIVETFGNASAMHAFDFDTASAPQTVDNDTKISDIKTKTDFLPSVTAGGAGGLFIAGVNAATTVTTSFTTTFTGNLTGSVDSVSGDTKQTADHTSAIADIPTVAAFNARTLVAANYFDAATDTVANVTLVATTTTNTDMRGTDSANTVVPPSVSQFNARTLLAASYFDPTADAVANVTLVATTTTNTDMRGTDSAATAANLATVDTNVDAILVDTGTTIPAQITALNDLSFNDIWTTQLTESYSSDGTAPTPAQALFLTMQNLQEVSYAGTVQTVKKLDGSATAATYTLDDATNPTSKTRAS